MTLKISYKEFDNEKKFRRLENYPPSPPPTTFLMARSLFLLVWYSNRTETSVDDGERKSNNWLVQWQSGKLGTGSRV